MKVRLHAWLLTVCEHVQTHAGFQQMEQYANYKKSKYQVSWFCICFFQRKSILLSNPFLSATAYNSCSIFLGVGFQTCVRQCEYKMLHISHLAIPRCFSCKEESVACHRAQVIISVLSSKTFKLEFCVSEFIYFFLAPESLWRLRHHHHHG